MEKEPDEPEDFTNEVQAAVASTTAMPFAQPIIAASKSKAQTQRISLIRSEAINEATPLLAFQHNLTFPRVVTFVKEFLDPRCPPRTKPPKLRSDTSRLVHG
ncbi:hypothetical protein HHI36_004731 [Cryptolaemus montrouzieri]|uniref:Uncharacterized protein n=1 Tax=Cryptolaemus montrouzieri TaxID=559131 RepID=A0ABD2NS46_9CUCU